MKANTTLSHFATAFDKELRAYLQHDLKNFKIGKGRFLVNNKNRHNKNEGFQVA
jgi:hypothetical protein